MRQSGSRRRRVGPHAVAVEHVRELNALCPIKRNIQASTVLDAPRAYGVFRICRRWSCRLSLFVGYCVPRSLDQGPAVRVSRRAGAACTSSMFAKPTIRDCGSCGSNCAAASTGGVWGCSRSSGRALAPAGIWQHSDAGTVALRSATPYVPAVLQTAQAWGAPFACARKGGSFMTSRPQLSSDILGSIGAVGRLDAEDWASGYAARVSISAATVSRRPLRCAGCRSKCTRTA